MYRYIWKPIYIYMYGSSPFLMVISLCKTWRNTMQHEWTPGVGYGTAQHRFAQLQHAEHSQPNGLVSLKVLGGRSLRNGGLYGKINGKINLKIWENMGSPLTQEYGILMRSLRKYGKFIYKSRICVFDCRKVVAFTAGGGEVIEGEVDSFAMPQKARCVRCMVIGSSTGKWVKEIPSSQETP